MVTCKCFYKSVPPRPAYRVKTNPACPVHGIDASSYSEVLFIDGWPGLDQDRRESVSRL